MELDVKPSTKKPPTIPKNLRLKVCNPFVNTNHVVCLGIDPGVRALGWFVLAIDVASGQVIEGKGGTVDILGDIKWSKSNERTLTIPNEHAIFDKLYEWHMKLKNEPWFNNIHYMGMEQQFMSMKCIQWALMGLFPNASLVSAPEVKTYYNIPKKAGYLNNKEFSRQLLEKSMGTWTDSATKKEKSDVADAYLIARMIGEIAAQKLRFDNQVNSNSNFISNFVIKNPSFVS